MFLHNLTMADILLRIVAALIFAALAGGLMAGFLRLFGDATAAQEGRLTANPFAHVTLSGLFLAIAFRSSWIQPLPIRRGTRSLAPLAAVLASMAVMLALVPLLDLIRTPLHAALPRSIGYMALAEIECLQVVLVSAICLGLLPLSGMLLGSAVPALWPRLEKRYRKLQGIGMALAAILLILGWFPDVMPLVKALRLV